MDIVEFVTKTKMVIEVIAEKEDLLPMYASEMASGADIKANISEAILLKPFERKLIPTGLTFAIPPGFEIQIRPRSGLAAKYGITVLNTPGTIDPDFRGEVHVILINLGDANFTITPFMRIAQIVVAPSIQATFALRDTLNTTLRGSGGFGHTGI